MATRWVRLDAGWHPHRHRLPLPRLLDGLDLVEISGGDLRHPAALIPTPLVLDAYRDAVPAIRPWCGLSAPAW